MLTHADNELICRVGPGTPTGAALRQFWVPALLTAELPALDSDPVALELLGERLVAFRTESGEVGLIREQCCHRSASLAVARVEPCGLRCIYHGWLFAPDGTVLETPNVADPAFRHRVKGRTYPVFESGGLIWAYLGDPAKVPPLPDFPFVGAPAAMRVTAMPVMAYNYVGVLEGMLDSSHLGVLHKSEVGKISGSETNFAQQFSLCADDAPPVIESEMTDFGLHYAALRPAAGGRQARVTAFVAPFWMVSAHRDSYFAAVPMNDEATAFFHVWYDGTAHYGEEPLRTEQLAQVGVDTPTLEAFGMTRATMDGPNAMRRSNRWRQDRQAMRDGHFTGMKTITLEDVVVNISTGALRDRSEESLSPADMPIMHLYRTLLKSARAAAQGGRAVGAGLSVARIGGANGILAPGERWQALVPDNAQAAPAAELLPAE